MDQRSAEWFAARCGKVTASRIADLMARTKTGWGASRANYAAELVAQRLSGIAEEGYSNAAMKWGTETEPEARAAYCFFRDADVTEVGFVDHPTILMSGASPDGLVGKHGLVEIKCPQTATHIDTLLKETGCSKYALQMQWQMACTGRDWCDFVSYDPRLPETMRLYVRRIMRSDETIAEIEEAVRVFLTEIEETVSALRSRYEQVKEAA